jgi:hypothetical protein
MSDESFVLDSRAERVCQGDWLSPGSLERPPVNPCVRVFHVLDLLALMIEICLCRTPRRFGPRRAHGFFKSFDHLVASAIDYIGTGVPM